MIYKSSGVAKQQGLGANQGVWGQKSPSGVQGRSPGGGLGRRGKISNIVSHIVANSDRNTKIRP